MSILLVATLAAASAIQPSCSWDRPGANPYTGKTATAVDRYSDIPASVRRELKQRIADGKFDEMVAITRDAISGKGQYSPTIHDMHFGPASVCANITRSKWSDTRSEPAEVYCVKDHCILIPRICGNVSRIERRAPTTAKAGMLPGKMGSKAGGANGSNGAQEENAAPAAAFYPNRNLADDVVEHMANMFTPDATPHSIDTLDEEQGSKDAASHARQVVADLENMTQFDVLAQSPPTSSLDLAVGDSLQAALDLLDARSRLSGIYGNRGLLFRDGGGEDGNAELLSPAQTIPEPSSWAILLAGLGTLLLAARRRRSGIAH